MKRKYIKLNDGYSHLSIGNVINIIKLESKNKTSAIQSEVFCAIFNIPFINESTVNNYCIGSRSIGNDYKQIYINLKKKYQSDINIFVPIINNILSIIYGSLYNYKTINEFNNDTILKKLCSNLYNISKNDFYVSKELLTYFKQLNKNKDYYKLFVEILFYAILDAKQPLYEDEKYKNVVETILQNTDISVNDLQNFLILELNEGINFSHSLKCLYKEGNAYASYHLGVMEYKGEFTGIPRYDKAYEYFLHSSNANHPASCWMIGNMIIKNKIGNKEYDEAIKYFNKAISLGSVAAINSLGICYKYGLGVKRDIDKALNLFKSAANKKYVYAYNNLGKYYEDEKNYDEAIKYYLKSADLNESYACNKVGEYYRLNNDKKNAFIYYNKALECTINEISIWTYYNLAKYFYLNGDLETNTLKDIDKAIKYFKLSSSLIESLQELLFIYYEKNNLENILYYKKLIEEHKNYNGNIKEKIENKLITIKKKKEINIP